MRFIEMRSSVRSRISYLYGCMWAAVFALLTAPAAPTLAADEASIPPKSQRSPEIRIAAAQVVLPIVMVREFPFIEGSVAGVSGKLILDTGNDQSLTINDHRVPLAGGRSIGTSYFGSGQSFAVRLMPEVRNVRIGTLLFPRVTAVTAQDARQLEAITSDFIGFFGFNAWSDHALKLDYRRSIATFYAGGPETYLKGERLVADLPFTTRKLPNHPVVSGQIGAMPVVTACGLS